MKLLAIRLGCQKTTAKSLVIPQCCSVSNFPLPYHPPLPQAGEGGAKRREMESFIRTVLGYTPLLQSGEPARVCMQSVSPFCQRRGRTQCGHPTVYPLRVKVRLGGIKSVANYSAVSMYGDINNAQFAGHGRLVGAGHACDKQSHCAFAGRARSYKNNFPE